MAAKCSAAASRSPGCTSALKSSLHGLQMLPLSPVCVMACQQLGQMLLT